MKFSFLFLFLFLFISLPLISAGEDVDISYGKETNLKRTCFNNGTWCSSSASCNITIEYPDGEIMKENVLMSNKVSYHNITILKSEANQLGTYKAVMVCTDPSNDLSGSDTFKIIVTGDGFGLSAFPIQLILILLGVLMIIVGSFNDKLKIIKILGAMFTMIMGVITLYPGWSVFNYSNLQGQSLGFILIGLGFIFMIIDSFSKKEQADTYQQDWEDDGRYYG